MSAPSKWDTIGGWALGIYAGAVALTVSLSPWLKEQKWWLWKGNRKVGG